MQLPTELPLRRPGGAAGALVAPAAVLVAAAVAIGFVAAVDPNEQGHYPTCPFLWLTGHFCPGCGSLRAVHALTHGDLISAVGFNALTVATLPMLTYLWLRWAAAAARADTGPRPLAHRYLGRALLVAVVAFWALRNTPWGAALAP